MKICNPRSIQTEYKYVRKKIINGKIVYQMAMGEKYKATKDFESIRECAIAVDKFLISKGKEPVNILKRK